MNYEIKSLLQSEKPAIDNENGKLWQIKNAVLLHGNFLLWNNFVIKESLHENFSPSWIKYWLKERGETFGGKKSDQVRLVNRGKTLEFLNVRRTILKQNFSGFVFQYAYDHNFHHFIVTALPRLNHFLSSNLKNTKVIVKSDTPLYQLEIINYLIPKEQIFIVDPMVSYEFESTFINPFPQWESIELIDRFYSTYFQTDAHLGENLSKKFYLSREDSKSKRNLLNAKKLEELLANYGFENIIASNLSLKERMLLFSKAKVLIGVFSAGLANLVFSPNCKYMFFIEHPIYKLSSEYVELCRLRGIKLIIIKRNLLEHLFFKAY